MKKIAAIILIFSLSAPLFAEKVYINADNVYAISDDKYVAEGNVLITIDDNMLKADKITIDNSSGLTEAVGDVYLKFEDSEIRAERLDYNYITRELGFENGELFIPPYYYIKVEKMEGLRGDTLKAEMISISTCSAENPDWSFFFKEANIKLEERIRGTHVTVDIFGVSAAYSPWMHFPINRKRKSGFLLSTIGSSTEHGYTMTNKYFIAISDDMDTTFGLNFFTERNFHFLNEARYAIGEDEYIYSLAEYISDTDPNIHTTNRWRGMGYSRISVGDSIYFTANVDYVSDHKYYEDFYRYSINREPRNAIDDIYIIYLNAAYPTTYADFNVSYVNNVKYIYLVDGYMQNKNESTPEVVIEKTFQQSYGSIPLDINYKYRYNNFQRIDTTFSADELTTTYEEEYRRHFLDLSLYKTFDVGIGHFTPRANYHHTIWNDYTLESVANSDTDSVIPYLRVDDSYIERRLYSTEMKFNMNELYKYYGDTKHSIYSTLTHTYYPELDQTNLPSYLDDDQLPGENSIEYSLVSYIHRDPVSVTMRLSEGYDIRTNKFTPIEMGVDVNSDLYEGRVAMHYDHYIGSKIFSYMYSYHKLTYDVYHVYTKHIYDIDIVDDYDTSYEVGAGAKMGSLSIDGSLTYSGINRSIKPSSLALSSYTSSLIYERDCWHFGIALEGKRYKTLADDMTTEPQHENTLFFLAGMQGLGETKQMAYKDDTTSRKTTSSTRHFQH